MIWHKTEAQAHLGPKRKATSSDVLPIHLGGGGFPKIRVPVTPNNGESNEKENGNEMESGIIRIGLQSKLSLMSGPRQEPNLACGK